MGTMKNILCGTAAFGCVLMITAACGCASGDENEGTVEAGQVNALLHTQTAAGARSDATLRAYHFDGAALNSNGRDKLDRMLANGSTARPVTVYLDIAGDDFNQSAHQDAVARYLNDQGLAPGDVKIVMGPNPNAMHNAADNIAQLDRMESHDGGAGAAAPTDAGFAPGAGMAPSGMK